MKEKVMEEKLITKKEPSRNKLEIANDWLDLAGLENQSPGQVLDLTLILSGTGQADFS